MRRLKQWMSALALGLVLLLSGLATVSLSGCDMPEDEFYKKDTEWAPGSTQNRNKRYAFAYLGLLLMGTFFFWTVVKSSRRSVVKAGEEH